MKITPSNRQAARGFTLIEVLVVIGIMGILMTVSYPSIMNTLASRNLDNSTREIQAFIQQAKHRAVDTKIVHRVRFHQPEGTYWAYEVERMEADLSVQPPTVSWVRVPQGPRKTIPSRLNVTMDFPADGSNYVVLFSPLGTVPNFNVNQNSVILQSPKLDRPGQMDERVLSIFMGGSIHYAKRKSA